MDRPTPSTTTKFDVLEDASSSDDQSDECGQFSSPESPTPSGTTTTASSPKRQRRGSESSKASATDVTTAAQSLMMIASSKKLPTATSESKPASTKKASSSSQRAPPSSPPPSLSGRMTPPHLRAARRQGKQPMPKRPARRRVLDSDSEDEFEPSTPTATQPGQLSRVPTSQPDVDEVDHGESMEDSQRFHQLQSTQDSFSVNEDHSDLDCQEVLASPSQSPTPSSPTSLDPEDPKSWMDPTMSKEADAKVSICASFLSE